MKKKWSNDFFYSLLMTIKSNLKKIFFSSNLIIFTFQRILIAMKKNCNQKHNEQIQKYHATTTTKQDKNGLFSS